jgi:drug/metabolite transporter (DMT)-like permease
MVCPIMCLGLESMLGRRLRAVNLSVRPLVRELRRDRACYSREFMPLPVQVIPVGFSLGSVLCWGTSDFLGGYASRNANSILVTAITNCTGLLAILIVASLSGSAMPELTNIAWALAGGACGGFGLALFYRALAFGNMGSTAPVAAILAAAIPAIFGILTQGLPGSVQIAGFILATLGIWLISRSDQDGPPKGLQLAIMAGVGFAGFYIFAKQAGTGSALWLAASSRLAALVATATWTLTTKSFHPAEPSSLRLGAIAGVIDVGGTVCFFRALQTGRMDATVVLSSLYPVVTVLLARIILKEHFTRWKTAGVLAALAAVPLIAS